MSKQEKPKFGIDDALAHIKMVEESNAQLYASASPEGRAIIDGAQAALDEENAALDAQFDADSKIRSWAKNLLGYEISMNQIEDLKMLIDQTDKGKIFVYQNQSLIKTLFGTVDRSDRYLYALEKTIVDLTSKQVRQEFTDPSFSDLMKLAFKRLFKRSK